MRQPLSLQRTLLISGIAGIVAVIVSVASLKTGPVDVTWLELWSFLMGSMGDSSTASIMTHIRLPRTILAFAVGGGLAISGVVFQVLLRNVLAEPYILGISGGASVGALLAMATGMTAVFFAAVPVSAFLGSLMVVVIVYVVGLRRAQHDPNVMLLTGVMVGAFLSAVILVLVSVIGDPIRNALFWLIGYLGNATLKDVTLVLPVSATIVAILILQARNFNVLSLGEEASRHLGIVIRRVQRVSYLMSSLLTAVLVSYSGSIGFVGLIVPHLVRKLVGPDHRILLPVSYLAGGSFLVLADMIARSVISPSELPVGAVTAAIGAPLFIYLLRR